MFLWLILGCENGAAPQLMEISSGTLFFVMGWWIHHGEGSIFVEHHVTLCLFYIEDSPFLVETHLPPTVGRV